VAAHPVVVLVVAERLAAAVLVAHQVAADLLPTRTYVL
jgi:hypothetical protein